MNIWVEIITTTNEIEAQIVKTILEGEGIEVSIRSRLDASMPMNIGAGDLKIMVRQEDLQKATEILKAMEEG